MGSVGTINRLAEQRGPPRQWISDHTQIKPTSLVEHFINGITFSYESGDIAIAQAIVRACRYSPCWGD